MVKVTKDDMDKLKKSMKKTGKYLRELSVVVIGVAITISVTLWITNRNDKKDLALYLNAILIELNQNAKSFDNQARMFQKSARYADYIRSHDEKSISQDSLNYYYFSNNDGFGYALLQSTFVYRKNAFEMLKISGAMRQVDDKELLMHLWYIYNYMEIGQLFIDMCFQRKREEATIEWQRRMDGKPDIVPMQNFFSNSDFPYQLVIQNEGLAVAIRSVISRLEESKLVKR